VIVPPLMRNGVLHLVQAWIRVAFASPHCGHSMAWLPLEPWHIDRASSALNRTRQKRI